MEGFHFLESIHPKFLQFQWQDNLYQFQCLTFGLSCAPRNFTKLTKPLVALLRESGIRLTVYLDDILILCSCQDTLINQLKYIRDLFQVLELLIINKKFQREPAQEIVFLGLTISTTTMQVLLPRKKVAHGSWMIEEPVTFTPEQLEWIAELISSFVAEATSR